MIETGDPRVRPSKVTRGARFWRWTVVRHASPEKREVRPGHLVYQRRVVVRCVCGVERALFERQVTLGRSTGCASATCRRAYDGAIMSKIEQSAAAIAERIATLQAQLMAEAERLRALQAESLAIVEQARVRRRSGGR